MSTTTAPLPAVHQPVLTGGLVTLFAFCCGAIVSNLYYAQPLIELISPDIGLSRGSASLIVSLTQIGYAVGLLFLVPLGDLLENRRLMVATLLVTIASLIGAAMSGTTASLLIFSALIGFSSVSVQMMVPIAASMADSATRGRVVGTVMGGLMFGVLLSRPLASLIADHFGWRAVFGSAAALMVVIAIMLATIMPKRQPEHTSSYGSLLASMGVLIRTMPVLRQRSLYQACMFGALVLFWTAAPIELAHTYGYTQTHIAMFALVGATGILVAPITGRIADAGYGRMATLCALIVSLLSFLPALVVPSLGVFGLGITAVLLDMGLQVTMISGQREIYALDENSRSRLNSVFTTSIFVGGAASAALASFLHAHGGWHAIATAGIVLVAIPLIKFVIDQRGRLGRQSMG